MSVYIDKLRYHVPKDKHARKYGTMWCHLFADDEEELHEFAAKLGLKREYAQLDHIPHYDLSPLKRPKAIKLGAIKVHTKEYIKRSLAKNVTVTPE